MNYLTLLKKSFSTAVVKPSITLLCERNTDSIVKNVFNLKRKIKNYLKKNSQTVHSVYKELYYADLDGSVSDSNASVPSANIIGDYCLGLGINENIVNSCFSETSHKCSKLNNGAIIELHDFLINKKSASWQKFSEIIFRLSSGDFKINAYSARHQLNNLKKNYSKYLKVPKSKRDTEISDFLSMIFVTSTSLISNILDCDEEEEVPLLSSTLNIDDQSSSLLNLEDKLENISDSLNSERKKCQEKCIEVKTLTKKLNKIFV